MGVNAILTPTTPSPAFPLGSKEDKSPVEMYLNDVFTVPANLAGLPAISIPTGTTDNGLPLGLQIIGPAWKESEVLNIAFRLEQDSGFKFKPDQWWTN
jgi:aspartyl-tRNA(Asn)/glutamyl-tRNA(Gln) amidotransferase subunit A